MVKKETLALAKECVKIFDLGKSASKKILDGVQFVDRTGSSVTTTLLFSTGSIVIQHSGVPKSSIGEGFAQYRVPIASPGDWKLGDSGNIVNDVNSMYPAPQTPQMQLKSIAGTLGAYAQTAMAVKMIKNFLDVKYVYMEDRDIFCVKDVGETAATWVSSAADIQKSFITPSDMTKAFIRLFSTLDDAEVSFVCIDNRFTALRLTSAKNYISVTHVLATPTNKTFHASFSIGKTNLRLVKEEGQEVKLIKGEENMDVNQISALFGAKAQEAPEKTNEPVVTIESPTVPEEKPVTEQVVAEKEPEITEEKPSESVVPEDTDGQKQEEPELPLSESLGIVIAQIEDQISSMRTTIKNLREILKRVKKSEKTPSKAAEEKIADLESRIAKLKRALDAAVA